MRKASKETETVKKENVPKERKCRRGEGIDGGSGRSEAKRGEKKGQMDGEEEADVGSEGGEENERKREIGACKSTVKARNLNSSRFTLIAVQKSRHSHRVLHGSLPLPSLLLLLTMTLLADFSTTDSRGSLGS